MTTTARPTTRPTTRPTAPWSRERKLALAAGLFYVGTFVFSIPALGLYDGVLNDSAYVLGHGSGSGVLWGGLIEILTALTGIGTAVAVYPVIRRWAPGRAVGFVASRTLEAAMILTGVLAVLAVHTLRQDAAGADPAVLSATAHALVAVKDWTFLLGPGLMPALNALCFATVLRRTGLVPRLIPTIGLVGAPVLVASSLGTLFGAWDQVSVGAMLAALPIAAWELSVGLYLLVKGFRTPAAGTLAEPSDTAAPAAPVLAGTA
jgi:hypothetical protein